MFLYIYIFIIVTIASLIGSINGLGVTFLISLFLLLIDHNNHQGHAWIPYFSTFLISFIFITTRLKIVFRNFGPVLSLCIFSVVGLLIGKVFKENTNLLWIKMFFGALVIYLTYYLNRINFFSKLNISLLDNEVWSFTTTDNLIILLIGFVGGLLDFSMPVMIYLYLIYNKEEYSVEHLDVCAYSTLALTSFINCIYIIFTREVSTPDYFNLSYVLAIIIGAFTARSIYHMVTLEYKRKFLVFALFSLGFKLLVLNFILERVINKS